MTQVSRSLRSRSDGLENILIPGATARISSNGLADLLFVGMPNARQKLQRRQHHSRRTVSALQTGAVRKPPLNRMQLAIFLQALDGGDFSAVGLHCKHRAGFHSRPIEQNST